MMPWSACAARRASSRGLSVRGAAKRRSKRVSGCPWGGRGEAGRLAALLGEGHVHEAGEAVLVVPERLTVADEGEQGHGLPASASRASRPRGGAQEGDGGDTRQAPEVGDEVGLVVVAGGGGDGAPVRRGRVLGGPHGALEADDPRVDLGTQADHVIEGASELSLADAQAPSQLTD